MENNYLSHFSENKIEVDKSYLNKWTSNMSLISDFYMNSTSILTQQGGDRITVISSHSNVIENILEIGIKLDVEYLLNKLKDQEEPSHVLITSDEFNTLGKLRYKSILIVPVFIPDKVIFGYLFLVDQNESLFTTKTIKLINQVKELIQKDLSFIYKESIISNNNLPSEYVYKVLYEKSGAISSFYNAKLKLFFYNDNFKSTYLDQDGNKGDKSTINKEYSQIILPHLKKVVETNKAINSIDRIEQEESFLWMNSEFIPVLDTENQLIGIHVISNNITELIAAKEKVINKKHDLLEYERIFNLVANPICIVDINGVFIKTNPAFQRILGYASQEVEGHSMFEMIHPEDLQRSIDYIGEKIKEQPELLEFENRYLCKDGSVVWFSWMVQPIYEKGISYSVAHDITKLKLIEEELSKEKEKALESDRLKTAFLCNMSHEIRTPMNGIVGFSDLLKSTTIQNDELSYYCDIIRSSGQQLLRIVNDIIDISKIEIGEIEIIDSEVNINELINSLIAFYKPDITNQGLQIITDVPLNNEEAYFRCDETKLRQILDNLISNALKFTEKGYLKIEYKIIGSEILISVEDTGIGIPEDKKESVFERFAQLKESNKSYGGAGLGLAICKAYTNKMGGDIWVESSLGSGSTFTLSLPLKK